MKTAEIQSAGACVERILSARLRYPLATPPVPPGNPRKQLIDLVVHRILDGGYELTATSCPCRQGTKDYVIATAERYGLPLTTVVCNACGTLRFDPYLSDASTHDFYENVYQQMYGRSVDPNEYFVRQGGYARKILHFYRGHLPPGADVLETGCGSGGALRIFQEQGYKTAGCDFDRGLLDYGTSRGVRELVFGSVSALAESLPDRKYDLIYSHHVFEHVADPLQELDLMRQLLKPEGRILHVVPDIRNIHKADIPAGDVLAYLHIAHKYNFSREGLREMAHQVGLTMTTVDPPRMDTAWSRAAEMWVEFRLPLTAQAPSGQTVCVNRGEAMLAYLKRTEWQFRRGWCRAQWRQVQHSMLENCRKRLVSGLQHAQGMWARIKG